MLINNVVPHFCRSGIPTKVVALLLRRLCSCYCAAEVVAASLLLRHSHRTNLDLPQDGDNYSCGGGG